MTPQRPTTNRSHAHHRPLKGSHNLPISGSKVVGAVSPRDSLQVTMHLRYRTDGQAVPTHAELAKSPFAKRHRLSAREFADRHGAHADDVARIQAFAHTHNLSVAEVHLAARMVVLSGTVSAVSAALGVALHHYEHAAGKYRSHTGPVYLPSELHDIVDLVTGLDTRPVARPRVRTVQQHSPHADSGVVGFLPTDLATLYNFPADADGTGQTIAILELGGGYESAVLDEYFTTTLKLPQGKIPAVTSVGVASAHNDPNGADMDADGEVYLDIEVIGALAPGAELLVYFGPNQGDGFLRTLAAAVHDETHSNTIISISWGGAEQADDNTRGKFDQLLQEAATTKHITVLTAAGDNGASDARRVYYSGKADPADTLAHVDYPSASPYVLACGGTRLIAPGGTIDSETVWNESMNTDTNWQGQTVQRDSATGGGVSELYPRPDYQAKANVPVSVNTRFVGRGIPDVAAVADPYTGYVVQTEPGQTTVIGGTSAVAPLWAALIARFNQKMGSPLGFLNKALYAIGSGSGFHDITSGDNTNHAGLYSLPNQDTGGQIVVQIGQVQGYTAAKGWDACTGWGSPNGEELFAAIKLHHS